MGFTEATDFLQDVGYEWNIDEGVTDYLERAAQDAMNAGLSAEIAARALSLLFENVREAREVNLFGQALTSREQTPEKAAPSVQTPPEIVEMPEKTIIEIPVASAPKATLADLERVLLRDDSRQRVGVVRSDSEDDELSWQILGVCTQTDPEAFFPEKGGSTKQAKKICSRCEVRAECLEYALANNERFGIWGGLSERERRKLKSRQVA